MRTTKATEKFPEIEWEEMELLERDPDERMEVYNCSGVGSNGKNYSGSAYYFANIFEEIKDIQEV